MSEQGVKRKNRLPDHPTQAPFTSDQLQMLRRSAPVYDPIYCERVVEDLAQGYSLGGFAGRIGISRMTINSWREKHPAFDLACARAMSVRLRWWETKAIYIAETGGQGSQGQMVMFGLINSGREDWKNKQEIEHTGQITLATLVDSAMKTINARQIDAQAVELPDLPSVRIAGAESLEDAF